MRLILLGNAGAGKSTMARWLIGSADIPRLSLDEIAWDPGTRRKPLEQSLTLLRQFLRSNDQWIIEGCYGDLVEAALPHCTELRFLNPGVETCVAHCNRRPWESSKFSSTEDQNAMLAQLIRWVKDYETRDDEYGLKRHRRSRWSLDREAASRPSNPSSHNSTAVKS
jgi:adenylate kinase family enzyme